MPLFKKKKTIDPEILDLKFGALKTRKYSQRKLIKIGDSLFFRKDLVAQKIADVINLKIDRGELIKVKGESKKAKGKGE